MVDNEIQSILYELQQLHIREATLKDKLRNRLDELRIEARNKHNEHDKERDNNDPNVPTKGPVDRYGKTITLGATVELLTRGKSKCGRGKVVKITFDNTIIVDDKGRKQWRNHRNVRII